MFICKTPHLASCFRVDSICAGEDISQVRCAVLTDDCDTACMLANCGKVLAQQDLALVLEVIVQNFEDILAVAECERVAAPRDTINSVR
jgi:hypothetical protein